MKAHMITAVLLPITFILIDFCLKIKVSNFNIRENQNGYLPDETNKFELKSGEIFRIQDIMELSKFKIVDIPASTTKYKLIPPISSSSVRKQNILGECINN